MIHGCKGGGGAGGGGVMIQGRKGGGGGRRKGYGKAEPERGGDGVQQLMQPAALTVGPNRLIYTKC
jgi:hypothetical protein